MFNWQKFAISAVPERPCLTRWYIFVLFLDFEKCKKAEFFYAKNSRVSDTKSTLSQSQRADKLRRYVLRQLENAVRLRHRKTIFGNCFPVMPLLSVTCSGMETMVSPVGR